MSVSVVNRMRWRSVLVSRAVKELFWMVPLPRHRIWRWLLLAEDGQTTRRVAEAVLADIRDYCFLNKSTFDPDPLVMARRNGRRDVGLRIINYLNLDEAAVQQLMEIDDGIG